VAGNKTRIFTGGTANAHGDHDGTGDPYTIFTVTGVNLVRAIFGECNTSLVGAATVEVGTANNTAKLLAQIANATTLDAGDFYTDAGTEAEVELLADSGSFYVINDDIVETLASANVTAGQIDYYVVWAPAEPGASIVSATAVA